MKECGKSFNWQASKVSETLLSVENGKLRYIHVYVYIY